MENVISCFHINTRKNILAFVLFAVALVAINIFVALSVRTYLVQQNVLLHSNYLHSYNAMKNNSDNTYLQFDAGIEFSTSKKYQNGINAEVLMQTDYSNYTDTVFWNANKMSLNDVAISKGIAKRKGLSVGKSLYSKHVVDGKIHKYIIREIIPDVLTARVNNASLITDGIIIMGFDSAYEKNITHSSLVFTNNTLDALLADNSENITNIMLLKMMPYYLLLLFLSVAMIIGFSNIEKNDIEYNLRRLIILGYSQKSLKKGFFLIICGTGIGLISISSIVSIILFIFFGTNVIVLCFILLVIIAELIALFAEENVMIKRLWRQ